MHDGQSIFVVRQIADRQMVGVFVAYVASELLDLIDMATEPFECEFAILERLAIIWEGATYSIPFEDDGDEPMDHSWTISESMRLELESATWTKIADAVAADEEP